jgi:hypothetical protein
MDFSHFGSEIIVGVVTAAVMGVLGMLWYTVKSKGIAAMQFSIREVLYELRPNGGIGSGRPTLKDLASATYDVNEKQDKKLNDLVRRFDQAEQDRAMQHKENQEKFSEIEKRLPPRH